MLLPDNIHPEKTIYYNGALVLQALQTQATQNVLDLFQNVRKQRMMSFAVFLLCLDWLYLINVAILNQNGEVELCT